MYCHESAGRQIPSECSQFLGHASIFGAHSGREQKMERVAEGNEFYIVVTVSIPKGEAYGKGEEYDGYSMAESYKMKLEEQKAKAEQKAKEKERKIARDKALREQKGE